MEVYDASISDPVVLEWRDNACFEIARAFLAVAAIISTSGTTRLIQNSLVYFGSKPLSIGLGSDAHFSWWCGAREHRVQIKMVPAHYRTDLELLCPPTPTDYSKCLDQADVCMVTYPYDPLELDFQKYAKVIADTATLGVLDGAWLTPNTFDGLNEFALVFFSAHKLGGAPQGVGSVLNFGFEDWERLDAKIQDLETSSPVWKNYAHTSEVFHFYSENPDILLAQPIMAAQMSEALQEQGFRVLKKDDIDRKGVKGLQRCKVHVILKAEHGVSGYRLAEETRKKGIILEKCGPNSFNMNGTFRMFNPDLKGMDLLKWLNDEDIEETAYPIAQSKAAALRECFDNLAEEGEEIVIDRPPLAHEQETVFELNSTAHLIHRAGLVNLRDVNGRIAARGVAPYPPGCEILHSGQIWNERTQEFCTRMIELGGEIRGIEFKDEEPCVWVI